MNTNLSLRIERIICKPHLEIKEEVLNFSFYEQSWKAFNIKIDKTTNTFTFRPFPRVKFQLKHLEIGNDYVVFDYLDGIYLGQGIWKIQDLGDNRTNVSYSISIKGRNRIINTLYNSKFFIWKHKRDINSLINTLKN